MNDDRKPKDMIGLRNHQGRSSLSLSDDDHPTTWIRRRRVDVEARNKGGHLTVKPTAVGLDGYFGIGQKTDGILHVMGDADAYGTFSDRGPFIADSGFIFNSVSITSSYDGRGQILSADRLGYVPNNQGVPCPIWLNTAHSTRDGTHYTELFAFYFVRPIFKLGSESVNGLTIAAAARYGPSNSQSRINMMYGGVVLDNDKQFRPFIIRDLYNGDVSLGYMPFTKDQYPWDLTVKRLSPTILMSKLTYMRSQYPLTYDGLPIPNRVDNAACPGYEIRFSHDNGLSWTSASSTEFFSEFDDTVLTLPSIGGPPETAAGSQDTRANATFNTAISYFILQSAPISATKAICYGLVPYTVYVPESNAYRVGGKVKLGIIDAAAGTVVSTLTLYDNEDVDKAWYYMGNQALEPIKGGALIGRAPLVDPSNHVLDHLQPGFTPDGVSIVWQPPMDVPDYRQGFFVALGPNEVGSVSYYPDQGYILKSTRDRGATWKYRAVITTQGVPPAIENQNPSLTQFAGVSQIRTQNLGSNPMQGVPWVCNSRIAAPIL